jgi:hypothetical protein
MRRSSLRCQGTNAEATVVQKPNQGTSRKRGVVHPGRSVGIIVFGALFGSFLASGTSRTAASGQKGTANKQAAQIHKWGCLTKYFNSIVSEIINFICFSPMYTLCCTFAILSKKLWK